MKNNERHISLYVNKNQVLNAAIDRIVVEIFNKKNKADKAQSIVFTGCSPLVGTTSTCIGLGIAVATSKRKTLVIDCDVRKALKYKKLNEQASTGLANYLLYDDTDLDEIVYGTNIDNLYYIPCGSYSKNSTRILCSERMDKLINAVKEQFDCIIFDFPAITIVPDAQILFQRVDGIVLLASVGETRKKQINEAKLKVLPFSEKYYGMIVNKIPLDMYRMNVRDYDYYIVNKKGEQNLNGNSAVKKYMKNKQMGGKQCEENN